MKKLILMGMAFLITIPMMSQDFKFNEVVLNPEETTFNLFAPANAKSVKVRLYKDGVGGKALKTVKMTYDASKQIWTANIKGDLRGRFYTFDIGRGECPGVFAKAVGENGRRGTILNLIETDPDDWCCDQRPVTKSPADLVIYELHHRDFSIDPSSGIKHKGKFLALTEQKAIDHLKTLGVNAVHILPSFDYASVDESITEAPQYNWGYDPLNYNVPEGSYSTNPKDPKARIREFKQMVQALHKAGIRVILDVVYNHTFDINGSNFQKTYPDYYFRKNADGTYSNGSGCGNETASEQPMMRRFIVESVKYWANTYRVDGFRFDLMGIHDIETMNIVREELDKIDPNFFVYGEGWSAGSCAYPQEKLGMKANIGEMPRIAAFSDELRDGLRGPFSDDTKGAFLAGIPGSEESIKFGIVGGISHPQVDMSKVNYSKEPWAEEPTQMICYVSCHDDMCLVDRLMASIPSLKGSHASWFSSLSTQQQDELIRLDLLAQTAVFTSQGVPFMLSGEEILRDKKGVHNSFNSPDSINSLDWSRLEKYPQVFRYYCDLIQLRNHHPAFRLGDAHLVRKHLEFLDAPQNVVAFRLKNYAGRDDWRNIIVILNANRETVTVGVPKGMYTIVCKDGEINEQSTSKTFGRKISVSPQSALIMYEQ
ncbi:MAG: type I pullulanase [Prevotella sp.]|nr:type I pullulanase [Prevotella sp.]